MRRPRCLCALRFADLDLTQAPFQVLLVRDGDERSAEEMVGDYAYPIAEVELRMPVIEYDHAKMHHASMVRKAKREVATARRELDNKQEALDKLTCLEHITE